MLGHPCHPYIQRHYHAFVISLGDAAREFINYRKCFFTSENAHQMKQDFMKCINYAGKDGGFFTCSFRDNEFGDFLLFKKQTTSQLPLKTAVSHSGLQLSSSREVMDNSVWVLGPEQRMARQ